MDGPSFGVIIDVFAWRLDRKYIEMSTKIMQGDTIATRSLDSSADAISTLFYRVEGLASDFPRLGVSNPTTKVFFPGHSKYLEIPGRTVHGLERDADLQQRENLPTSFISVELSTIFVSGIRSHRKQGFPNAQLKVHLTDKHCCLYG